MRGSSFQSPKHSSITSHVPGPAVTCYSYMHTPPALLYLALPIILGSPEQLKGAHITIFVLLQTHILTQKVKLIHVHTCTHRAGSKWSTEERRRTAIV